MIDSIQNWDINSTRHPHRINFSLSRNLLILGILYMLISYGTSIRVLQNVVSIRNTQNIQGIQNVQNNSTSTDSIVGINRAANLQDVGNTITVGKNDSVSILINGNPQINNVSINSILSQANKEYIAGNIVKITADTQLTTVTANTTIKNTVDIPQSIVNSINNLVRQGSLRGSNADAIVNALYSNKDKGRILDPIVANIATDNTIVTNDIKSKSEILRTAYDMNDKNVLKALLEPTIQISNISISRGNNRGSTLNSTNPNTNTNSSITLPNTKSTLTGVSLTNSSSQNKNIAQSNSNNPNYVLITASSNPGYFLYPSANPRPIFTSQVNAGAIGSTYSPTILPSLPSTPISAGLTPSAGIPAVIPSYFVNPSQASSPLPQFINNQNAQPFNTQPSIINLSPSQPIFPFSNQAPFSLYPNQYTLSTNLPNPVWPQIYYYNKPQINPANNLMNIASQGPISFNPMLMQPTISPPLTTQSASIGQSYSYPALSFNYPGASLQQNISPFKSTPYAPFGSIPINTIPLPPMFTQITAPKNPENIQGSISKETLIAENNNILAKKKQVSPKNNTAPLKSELLTPSIVNNIISLLVPTVDSKSINIPTADIIIPENRNLSQNKNLSIIFSNKQQFIDTSPNKNFNNIDSNVLKGQNTSNNLSGRDFINQSINKPMSTLTKPELSIKIQEQTKLNTNSTTDDQNSNIFSNIDTTSTMTTVLSVFTANPNTNSASLMTNQAGNSPIFNAPKPSLNNNSNILVRTQSNSPEQQSNQSSFDSNLNNIQGNVSKSDNTTDSSTSNLSFPALPIVTLNTNTSNISTIPVLNSNFTAPIQNPKKIQIPIKNTIPIPKLGISQSSQISLQSTTGAKSIKSPINLFQAASRVMAASQINAPFFARPNVQSSNQVLYLQKNLKDLSYHEYLKLYKPQFISKTLSSSQIYSYHMSTYRNNLAFINQHNSNLNRTYSMGLNSFTDISQQQFSQTYTKLKVPTEIKKISLVERISLTVDNQKSIQFKKPQKVSVDWSCHSQTVFELGKCGASWVASALESIYITSKIHKMNKDYFSIEQILACGGKSLQMSGCTYGYFNGVYNYVQNFGVGKSYLYPQNTKTKTTGKVAECSLSTIKHNSYTKSRFFIKGSARIPYGNCYEVVNQLKNRALTVGISTKYLQFYKKGTYSTHVNEEQEINHGVLLLGYDPQKGYLIKNSWGVGWGNRGYAYVDSSVGVCNFAMYPILTKEEEKLQKCPRQ